MAKLYKTNGTIIDITPKNTKIGFTLEDCYKLIGYNEIDAQCLGSDENGIETWFVTEYKILRKKFIKYNHKATERATEISGKKWGLWGNIIICGGMEFRTLRPYILNQDLDEFPYRTYGKNRRTQSGRKEKIKQAEWYHKILNS